MSLQSAGGYAVGTADNSAVVVVEPHPSSFLNLSAAFRLACEMAGWGPAQPLPDCHPRRETVIPLRPGVCV